MTYLYAGLILIMAALTTFYMLWKRSLSRFCQFLLVITIIEGFSCFLIYADFQCFSGSKSYRFQSVILVLEAIFPAEMWVYCFTGLRCTYDLRLEECPVRIKKIQIIGLALYSTFVLVYFVAAILSPRHGYELALYLNITILVFSAISLAVTSFFIRSVREIINDSRKNGNAVRIDSLSFIVNLFLFAGAVAV